MNCSRWTSVKILGFMFCLRVSFCNSLPEKGAEKRLRIKKQTATDKAGAAEKTIEMRENLKITQKSLVGLIGKSGRTVKCNMVV